MYEGISERKRSCPAVSHSCSRTVRSSRYMVLLRKSIPMVAWYVLSKESYMKRVISEVLPTACATNLRQPYLAKMSTNDRVMGEHPPDCSPKKTSLNFFKGFV